MSSLKTLQEAKKKKNDEFYTPYSMVESIVKAFKEELWKDQIIYCPCDAEWSNFPKYFKEHKELGYKDIWNTSDDFHTHTDLFEQCDIIITNPPFSIIRDWLNFIAKFNKKVIYVCPPTHAAYAFTKHRYYYTLIPGYEYYLNLEGILLEDQMRLSNKESLYGTEQMMKDKSKKINFENNLRGNKDYDLIAGKRNGSGYRFANIKNEHTICNLRGTNKALDKDLRGGIATTTNLRGSCGGFTKIGCITTTTNLRGSQYDVMPTHSNSNRDISFSYYMKNYMNTKKVYTKPKYLKDIQEEYYDEYRYRGHKVLNVNKLRDLPRDYFGYFGLPTTAIGSRNELNDMIDYIELIKKPVVNGKSKFQRFLCKWKNWEEPEEISEKINKLF